MSDPDGEPDGGPPRTGPGEHELRRLRSEVFGDVLPAGTSDERPEGWSEDEPSPEAADDWLRRQVPPHHG
jgi:hypothetical protein